MLISPRLWTTADKRQKKQSSEQSYAIVGLGSSAFSLFAAVAIYGVAWISTFLDSFFTPGLTFIACVPTACAGVLMSFVALIRRPGWIPVLGIFVGMIAILAGLGLVILAGIAQIGYRY